MKHHLLTTALLSLAALAGSASAAELSYTYLEADLTHVNHDARVNTDGGSIHASLGLPRGFHVIGGASFDYADDDGYRGISRGWYAGVGALYPISRSTHLVARVAYVTDQTDETYDDFGGLGRLYGESEAQRVVSEFGLRTALGHRWEGWLIGSYSEVEDFEIKNVKLEGTPIVDKADLSDDLGGEAYSEQYRMGALFKISPVWGITAEAKGNSDYAGFSLGARATF